MTPRTALQRWLADPLEAMVLRLVLGLFRLLGPENASNLGGWLGRTIGPLLPLSERARRNLRLAMPELSKAEIDRIVRGTWENSGRVFGEMVHLERMAAAGRIETVPEEIEALQQIKADGLPLLLLGGHLANFELFTVLAPIHGFPLTAVYRAPNNPRADRIWRQLRGKTNLLPKGPETLRAITKTMADGDNLALMIDQKLNEGIEVPFFGHPAMTNPLPAHFASRFKAPIIFGWAERLGPARYRVRTERIEPVEPAERSGSAKRAAFYETTLRINEALEKRIREQPENWFWLHRRWGKV